MTAFENIVSKISSILSLKIPLIYLHFAMHDAQCYHKCIKGI